MSHSLLVGTRKGLFESSGTARGVGAWQELVSGDPVSMALAEPGASDCMRLSILVILASNCIARKTRGETWTEAPAPRLSAQARRLEDRSRCGESIYPGALS